MSLKKHIIKESTSIKDAMLALDAIGADTLLFVVKNNLKLIGSITDGDIRRSLLNGIKLNESVLKACNKTPKYIIEDDELVLKLITFRKKNLKIIPVVNANHQIVDIINFRFTKNKLPVDTVIMAGGKGKRLLPYTENTPKPLLKIGDRPIIDHIIDRISYYGIKNIWLSIKHLGEQLENFAHEKSKTDTKIKINTFWDEKELGTIGSLKLIKGLKHKTILVCNSDLLTNVNFEQFYLDFINSKADISVLSIPYDVKIPYAVLELNNNFVSDLKEKPCYTYYSNGGMYLMKR